MIRLGEPVVHSEWYNGDIEEDDITVVDDANRIPEERALMFPVHGGADKGTRREQLKEFMRKKYVKKGNYQPLAISLLNDNEEEEASLLGHDEASHAWDPDTPLDDYMWEGEGGI